MHIPRLAHPVLVHEKKALIVQRSMRLRLRPGQWEPPSMIVAKGSVWVAAEEALRRKAGVKATRAQIKPVHVGLYGVPTPFGGSQKHERHAYLFYPVDPHPEIKLTQEHDTFTWVGLENLNSFVFAPGARDSIVAALHRHSQLLKEKGHRNDMEKEDAENAV